MKLIFNSLSLHKNKIFSVVLTATIVFLMLLYVAYLAPALKGTSDVREAGERLKLQIKNVKSGKDRIVAEVNGRPIHYSDISGSLFLQEMSGKELNIQVAVEKAIEEELLFQEAERLGLVPTTEEAKIELKKIVEKAKENEENYQRLKEYLAGLGMTEEEYIENPFIFHKYRKFMAIERAGEILFKDAKTKDEFEALRKAVIEKLKKEAVIKIC